MFEQAGNLIYVPPYYKYFPSKVWKKHCQAWDTMFDIAGQLVVEEYNKLQQTIKNDKKDSTDSTIRSEELEFLPYVLSQGKLTIKEVTANIIDLMIGGVDTVIYVMMYLLVEIPFYTSMIKLNIIVLLWYKKVIFYLMNAFKSITKYYDRVVGNIFVFAYTSNYEIVTLKI